MTIGPTFLTEASGLGPAFIWAARDVAHVEVKTDALGKREECCGPHFPVLDTAQADVCHATLGVGAVLLVALYGLALTAFVPLLLLIGGLMHGGLALAEAFGVALPSCLTAAAKELVNTGITIPVIVLQALYLMAGVIAAHINRALQQP
jgi:hypothetical protein